MSLDRVERFLAKLGNPHLKLPPVIHIAGTNGKGSTLAILRSLLEASGKKVHVATSPHLVHPTERIRLAGKLISTHTLIQVLEECLAINQDDPITFFEIFMAATFLIMSRTPADYVLLETGMGGRLDATNLVPDPVCTIITTISKDHETFLGSDLKSIAFEKAGIIKPGVPCVIGYQTKQAHDENILKIFHDLSKSLSPEAPLYQYGSDWTIEPNQTHLKWIWNGEEIVTSSPNLLGEHQIYNCGAALSAYRIIMGQGFDAKILSPQNTANPLKNIHWPGRLQKIETGSLQTRLSEGQELWLDGGHNDSAGHFLKNQAAKWARNDGKSLHLIIAMLNRKNPAEFLTPLKPYVKSMTVTSIPEDKDAYTHDALYELVEPLNFENLSKTSTVEKALANIHDKNARILITGSLHFIGNVMKEFKIY